MPNFKNIRPLAQQIAQYAQHKLQRAAQRRIDEVQQVFAPHVGVHLGPLMDPRVHGGHAQWQHPAAQQDWAPPANAPVAPRPNRQPRHPYQHPQPLAGQNQAHQAHQAQQQWVAQQQQRVGQLRVAAMQQAAHWRAMAQLPPHAGNVAGAGVQGPGPTRPPLGTVALSAAMHVTGNLRVREGGELQKLFYNGHLAGVMTRYPFNPQEVADTFRAALESPHPRIMDLAQPKDIGRTQSYVAELPEGKPTKVGDMWLCKQTVGKTRVGSNGQVGPDGQVGMVHHTRSCVYVWDAKEKNPSWKAVDHHDVDGWVDRTVMPRDTFEHLWRLTYRPGIFDQGVVHCYGGVGRTPTLMFRDAFQVYLEDQNRRGHYVSERESDDFIGTLTKAARLMRGGFVLPDDHQRQLLIHSCHLAVKAQRLAQPMQRGAWQQPAPMPQHLRAY